VSAQEGRRVVRRPPAPELRMGVFEYEKRVQLLSSAIKRDAFIIGQMVLALNDLTDFQKMAAIQKAIDRTTAASLRAAEDPKASPRTMTALSKIDDALKTGREQGTMADTDALRKTILEQSHFIQYELFQQLNDARGERLNLVEMVTRLQTVNADLEGSMVEALGSTFDFLAAGGK
jgi:hypothetical protein